MTQNIIKNEHITALEIPYFDKVLNELITPIHGILNLSDVMNETWNNIEETIKKECIRDIHNSAQTLIQLVQSLKQISDINNTDTKFNFTKVSVIPVVVEALALVEHKLLGKDLKIELHTTIDQCLVRVDVEWFKKLLINLLNNAINHTIHGTIAVDIDVIEKDSIKNLHIAVIDQGIGIKESELETIFEPLKRGSQRIDKFKGSGIGLTICKEIVEAHNGKIWARNNNDVGAKVEFTLPL